MASFFQNIRVKTRKFREKIIKKREKFKVEEWQFYKEVMELLQKHYPETLVRIQEALEKTETEFEKVLVLLTIESMKNKGKKVIFDKLLEIGKTFDQKLKIHQILNGYPIPYPDKTLFQISRESIFSHGITHRYMTEHDYYHQVTSPALLEIKSLKEKLVVDMLKIARTKEKFKVALNLFDRYVARGTDNTWEVIRKKKKKFKINNN